MAERSKGSLMLLVNSALGFLESLFSNDLTADQKKQKE
jgi:hypothetical protein